MNGTTRGECRLPQRPLQLAMPSQIVGWYDCRDGADERSDKKMGEEGLDQITADRGREEAGPEAAGALRNTSVSKRSRSFFDRIPRHLLTERSRYSRPMVSELFSHLDPLTLSSIASHCFASNSYQYNMLVKQSEHISLSKSAASAESDQITPV